MIVKVGEGTEAKQGLISEIQEIVITATVQLHTLYGNACCISFGDIYPSLGKSESCCAGVPSTMTGMHGRDEDESA